jgi:hypothetical protein
MVVHGSTAAYADTIIHELESRTRMPNEHMMHIAVLLDHGTRSGAIGGAAAVRDIAFAMARAPVDAATGLSQLRACVALLARDAARNDGRKKKELASVAPPSVEEVHVEVQEEVLELNKRCAALEERCARQAADIARLQSKCDRQARELASLHSATDKQRREREGEARAASLAVEHASKLRASVERAETKARAAEAHARRAEERCAALQEELDTCALDLAHARRAAETKAELQAEPPSKCACSELSDLAVRVWYMSGTCAPDASKDAAAQSAPEHAVSDAENAMSKQLMAVRALSQRLLVENKAADADVAASAACIELAHELAAFAREMTIESLDASESNEVAHLALDLPRQFLSCVASTDAAGKRRATRVMRVTLGLARRGLDAKPLTLEEHIVLHAAASIYKKRCSEELMCLCDVVDPLDVLREWHAEIETRGAYAEEAHNALVLVRCGKLVAPAYQIGAKRVLDKSDLSKSIVYFKKGAFIKQADGADESASTLGRLLSFRASRALAYD